MLVRMWRKRNTPPLLVGMQADSKTLGINLVVPQKFGNSSTLRSSYTILEHIPKKCPTIPQGNELHYVHSSLVCNSQKLEITQISLN